MTEQDPFETTPATENPALPGNSDQTFQVPLSAPNSATISTELEQTEQQLPLARRHVSPATAVLVFLVFLLLAMVSVAGWTLLHRFPADQNAEISQTQPIQTVPTAQIVSLVPADATASPAPSTPTPATAPASMVTTNERPEPTSSLAGAEAMYRSALQAGNFAEMERVRTLLAVATATDSQSGEAASSLASHAAYARDVLTGTVYLNDSNATRWQLADPYGNSLSYPIDMTVSDGDIYIIDSGSLYRSDLATLPVGGGVLTMTAVLTPTQWISGYPVKEVVALDGAAYTDAVFVLDKSNDIYRYQPSSGQWSLELPLAREYQNPDPFYQNLTTYSDRLYLLDPARNQIWRHSDAYVDPEYFASKFPWLLEPGDPDVSSGLDVAIDGNVYVLARDGSINVFTPAPLSGFAMKPAEKRSLVAGLEQTTAQPVAIVASADGVTLYIVDPGQRRVVAVDRRDGALLRQFMAPDNIDFAYLHAIAEHDDWLLLLAASRLYGIDLSTGITATASLTGQLPLLAPLPTAARSQLRPADTTPNDPLLPSVIASYGLTMPIQGALLPDRSAIYPGSRRAYRYGVHEGLDIYGRDVGVDLVVGTPVVAAADGVIMRADVDYRELSPQALNALLDNANLRHDTPRDALDKLSGRQIWIDHGDGLVTTYAHLDSIVEGIGVGQPVHAGQVIGAVGVSGTPDGAAGITQFAHLHFEIRLGDQQQYYLGQWLSIEETRRAFEQIFRVPVRPAYLDFRQ
ncbi:MAG: peptidoglycan DD-metalloendopeptidase family protein [Anaerolineae bacterium]|nr:peptidoglycan DD-metalloendopeptidase family protein [Anaerolineae bacterium]